jgi:hypothetical protein
MLENMEYVGVGFATVSAGAGPGGTGSKGAHQPKQPAKAQLQPQLAAVQPVAHHQSQR